MSKLTQKRLKEILCYDPETGDLKWIKKISDKTVIGKIAGGYNSDGYLKITINKQQYLSSRLIWFYMEGYFPENDIDHINRIRDDNRWCNLRHVSRSCNLRNKKISKYNTSGVTGVGYDKNRGAWVTYISPYKKTINLGRFKNKIDAVRARWEAEKKYDFPNCCTTSSAYQYLRGLDENFNIIRKGQK